MKKSTQSILISGAAGVFAFLASEISQETWKPFFDHVFPAISRSWLLLLLLLSVAVNLVFAYLLLVSFRKDPKKDYTIFDERGFYYDENKPNTFYCAACFSEDIFSPMTPRFVHKRGRDAMPSWKCPRTACNQEYKRKDGEGIEQIKTG